jgi:hypothetical protein
MKLYPESSNELDLYKSPLNIRSFRLLISINIVFSFIASASIINSNIHLVSISTATMQFTTLLSVLAMTAMV